jgi:transposase
MSRNSNHHPDVVERAKSTVHSARNLQEYRRAQSILLPALFGATIQQTAEALGVSEATVSRDQAAFRNIPAQAGTAPKANWGGRRNCWMSWEEENAFLAPWLEKAQKGTLVVASPIREALSMLIGKPVKASVVYRMLERHDWRKVAPDTRHPKSDPIVQEAWKKNSRKIWRQCSSRSSSKDAG